MSTTVEHVTINGDNDGRFVLANSQIARRLATTDFTRIRIGFRVAFDDTGATLTGTPRLWIGLLASPQVDTNGALSNGPANAVTSHFVGASPDSASWFRVTGTPIRYEWGGNSPHFSAIKRVGSTTTMGGSTNPYQGSVSASPQTTRTAVLVDIKRGSPNFTVSVGCPPDTVDQPYDLLKQAMEVSDFSSANQLFGSTRIGSGTIAVDETTDGALNAVCFYWDRATPVAHLSEVLFSFFQS